MNTLEKMRSCDAELKDRLFRSSPLEKKLSNFLENQKDFIPVDRREAVMPDTYALFDA